MGEGRSKGPWAIWKGIDAKLRGISNGLRKVVKLLRLVRNVLILTILLVFAGAGLSIWRPEYLPYAYLGGAIVFSIPIIILTVLVALPLRAKSVVRLIDVGYPQNAKELAIRVAVRKLHDESIATEEMLADTAINESRKWLKKYRQRAAKLDELIAKEKKGGAGKTASNGASKKAAKGAKKATKTAAKKANGKD